MGLKIGADIEFVFLKNNRLVSASTYLSFAGHFGHDGCSSIAELRPRPDEIPYKVVTSISRSIKQKVRSVQDLLFLDWRAGSYLGGHCLGGHIHFGTRAEYNRTSPRDIELDYLDSLLAMLLFLTESGHLVGRRIRGGYGNLRGYRSQTWGWEYRVLPSFVSDKKLTEGVLALAKIIIEHLNQEGNPVSQEEINDFQYVKVTDSEREAYYRGSKDVAITLLNRRINFIKKWLPAYRDFGKIRYLMRMAKMGAIGEYCISTIDMKKSWGVHIEITQETYESIWGR